MSETIPKKPPMPALELYRQQGCKLNALKQALQHGLAQKEKDLAKTFSRQLFQAVGSDEYRMRLFGQAELDAYLTLALARVDKIDDVKFWLEILEHPDSWYSERMDAILPLLNKAVTKLASHIPKTRNPSNEGAPRFVKTPCSDACAVTAGEAALSTATLEDATLVGARFFFESVFFLDGEPLSVLAFLLNDDQRLSRFLKNIGLSEAAITAWRQAAQQLPSHLSPLQAQLLLNDADDNWISVTPMLSVAVAAWLSHWRRETLLEDIDGTSTSHESKRPLFNIEAVEYGGTNARNIAAVLMDCSGTLYHPKIAAPTIRRDHVKQLLRRCHRPVALIVPKPLRGQTLAALTADYANLPNEALHAKLSAHIQTLLGTLLSDVIELHSLLDGESEDAMAFQLEFNGITNSHPNLRFALGNAGAADIKNIANTIVLGWLGEIEPFKGTAQRYHKIKQIVMDALQGSQLAEVAL